jgi:peptidoglycan/xylan/chitin deacetylase (PgdA/CDA1 family)
MYHRIAEAAADPWRLCVSPRQFEEHLQALPQVGHPMTLADLVKACQQERVPDRAIVLTFDDGYNDNLYWGKPLLSRYAFPATIYLTTGPVGREREFWWDELEQLLLEPGDLPVELQLKLGNDVYRYDLRGANHWTAEQLRPHAAWSMSAPDDPTPRHAAYRQLYYMLQSLPYAQRQSAMDELWAAAGRRPELRPQYRAVDDREMRQLVEDGLIEAGAHTVHHIALSAQPVEVQREEIAKSRQYLQDVLDRPIHTFSYPYGSYSPLTLRAVRDAGFTSACACGESVVLRPSDVFCIPRLEARPVGGPELARRLEEAFRGRA